MLLRRLAPVRRIALLTSACLLVIVAGGCNDDGRTLPPPREDQNLSISSVATTGVDGSLIDTTDGFETLPIEGDLEVIAPWRDGATIDARYTCDGLNVSPALSWSPAPEGTVEIAITLSDLDVPGFVHWAIAGLPSTATSIAEGDVPLGAYEAANSLGDIGYTGPCPTAGSEHLYILTVHYLAEETGLEDGVAGLDLLDLIQSVELSTAEVSGVFART